MLTVEMRAPEMLVQFLLEFKLLAAEFAGEIVFGEVLLLQSSLGFKMDADKVGVQAGRDALGDITDAAVNL